ncbi:DnaB-like helicase N-terminal domain-containing protein (plasmid) [Pseudonocardia bannensis]|uniref:DNA helicase DnaB-like N-terminal domain-containing protein n=1 Tax=Pseudonocardia bannensis TaxID=630973 RepID=A0A848DL71_9PSEU|nr:DnaB-like helicase N-terminal domain-containing protein [Pseudonocardia bannensis]NMH93510.1 hypothetical protein [Pseudonocardia bannensis]
MSTGAPDAARTTATDLAASALLGALLWDPRRVRDVADWLEPTDFGHWAHRAIYQTMTGLIADGREVDLLSLPEVLARGEYHDAHVDRGGIGPLSAPALHDLLSMTPATPRAEEHEANQGVVRSEHVRYARVVLEDSIRRQVQAAGTRIDQYARHATGQDADTAAEVMAPVLAETTARLRELTSRLGDSGALRSRIAAALDPATPATGPGAAGSTPDVEIGHPRPPLTAAGVQRAEYSLIGACLVSPQVRGLVEDRLLAEDFTTAEVAATWQAIRALSRRGDPVDFVLVAVEVERQGATPDYGPGLGAAELARVAARADAVSGYRAVDTVARAALSRAAGQAHRELQQLAGDRAKTGQEVLRGAQGVLTTVEATARRLGGNAAATAAAALTPPAERVPQPRPRADTAAARRRIAVRRYLTQGAYMASASSEADLSAALSSDK